MKVFMKNSSIVFQRKRVKQIVYKDYMVRQSGQYFNLSSLLPNSLTFDKVKGEIKFLLTENLTGKNEILSSRSDQLNVSSANKTLTWKMSSTNTHAFTELVAPLNIDLVWDNSIPSVTLNSGTPETMSAISTSLVNVLALYGKGNTADAVVATDYVNTQKFQELKIYETDNNTLLIHLRPAIVDGIPCLYEVVTDQEILSDDETTLVLEDAE